MTGTWGSSGATRACLAFFSFLLLIAAAMCRDCDGSECSNVTLSPLKFEDIVPKHYDKLVPPSDENGDPVIVQIKIAVLNIPFVDEAQQMFGADIFFHQIWRDSRVRIPPEYSRKRLVLDNKWRQHLWTPDTYFKDLFDGKVNDIIIPYSYMVMEEGELFFASRLSLKLNCEMNLASYPHDVQKCEILVMSLQHTMDSVILRWKEFQITNNIFLAQYYIRDQEQQNLTKTYKIGSFSYLVGRIYLARRLGYFLINKYIPCVLIVCMSFVTFWIPAEAYPARVTLSVTSLLTIVTQQYQSSMPSVSYVVALNIWMLSCIGFVFISLVEYAFVVSVMNNRGTRMWPFRKLKTLFSSPEAAMTDGEVGNKVGNHVNDESKGASVSHVTIDRAARFIFPFFFFIFCLCYFVYFCR